MARSTFTLFLAVILQVIGSLTSQQYEQSIDLCDLSTCDVINMTTTRVGEECTQAGGQLVKRCCYLNNSLHGVDLSDCSLRELSVLDAASSNTTSYNKSKLSLLILSDNPLHDCTEDAFHGLTNLQYLELPPACLCPGGDLAWRAVKEASNRTVCEGEMDTCYDQYNVTCPANSHCVMYSPGVTWCLCDDGYYGYKCLRSGRFPLVPFVGGMVGGTVVVAAILWCVFRRKVKQQ